MFKKYNHLNLLAYTNAHWADDQDEQNFTSIYFTLVRRNLVLGKTKRRKFFLYLVQRWSIEEWLKGS